MELRHLISILLIVTIFAVHVKGQNQNRNPNYDDVPHRDGRRYGIDLNTGHLYFQTPTPQYLVARQPIFRQNPLYYPYSMYLSQENERKDGAKKPDQIPDKNTNQHKVESADGSPPSHLKYEVVENINCDPKSGTNCLPEVEANKESTLNIHHETHVELAKPIKHLKPIKVPVLPLKPIKVPLLSFKPISLPVLKPIKLPIVPIKPIKKPIIHKPVVLKPIIIHKPVIPKPIIIHKPIELKPIIIHKPVIPKPVHKPIIHKPIKPIIHKPHKHFIHKPHKLIIHKPIVHKPITIHKPIIHKPIIHKPIIHKPIIHKPIIHKPIKPIFLKPLKPIIHKPVPIKSIFPIPQPIYHLESFAPAHIPQYEITHEEYIRDQFPEHIPEHNSSPDSQNRKSESPSEEPSPIKEEPAEEKATLKRQIRGIQDRIDESTLLIPKHIMKGMAENNLTEHMTNFLNQLDRPALLDVINSIKEEYLLKATSAEEVKTIEETFSKLQTSVNNIKQDSDKAITKRKAETKSEIITEAASVLELLAEENGRNAFEEEIDEMYNDYYNESSHEESEEVADEPSFLELISIASKHKTKPSTSTER